MYQTALRLQHRTAGEWRTFYSQTPRSIFLLHRTVICAASSALSVAIDKARSGSVTPNLYCLQNTQKPYSRLSRRLSTISLYSEYSSISSCCLCGFRCKLHTRNFVYPLLSIHLMTEFAWAETNFGFPVLPTLEACNMAYYPKLFDQQSE